MRVCFSKNGRVIKVVVDNNDHIPSNSQKVILLNLEKVSRKIFDTILESYLEDILWIYYLKLLNAKIVYLFLASCKKVFPSNMNWLFSAWSHLLNIAIMRVMMEEIWLILEVKFIWKINKSGAVRVFHPKVIIQLEIAYRQCIRLGVRSP